MISSDALKKLGFEKQGILEWVKGDKKITYDGANWKLNGQTIKFLEEIE